MRRSSRAFNVGEPQFKELCLPGSMDDNLEHVHAEWLRRPEQHEVLREEAKAVLPSMKARLDFLRNLHSGIA